MKICQIIADERDVWRKYDFRQPYFGPAPTALLEGFKAFPEIEVHVISCSRASSLVPDKLADNIFYHQVSVSGGYRRSLFIEPIRQVRGMIRDIRPDLVHGQGNEDYQGLCAVFSGHPNCITIHGNMREVAKKLGYRPFPHMTIAALFETLALLKTDAVFCNSVYTEQCVGLLNKHKPRVFNAVRPQFFDQKWISKGRQTMLCIGHIIPYKNQLGLIDALDGLTENQKFNLVFAGNCRPENDYGRRFLDAVSRRGWCEYAGRLEMNELQAMLCRSAGVIHPTLEESFGLAVAESQAAGVPVAASAVGGIPDLIEHGKTGLLFNPHDPEDVRQKVTQLLNRDSSEKLARNARAFAEAEYRPEVIARKHIEFYNEFLRMHS